MDFATISSNVAGYLSAYLWDGDLDANSKIIRIVAGALGVVVLVVMIQRRRTRAR